ncbi:hypothetical protein predicted by Glimmer/Critica [Sorangium cellulosum So ce56]|uniref:Uncharacterized protein n=1 Tax=Sorangium cellulosum (strain So ce56) TaxID=448385 RepID=A9ENP8_SORC5|nr:hypothetical protein [Sorangium cellulosum]CAN90885.1 hypothetical protein predicted by Glimmer/Critica [Sorangium cellulosum So ce56]
MTVEDVTRALDAAREELSAAAAAALSAKRGDGGWTRYQTAHDKCISLERDLARATGEECAVEIPWQHPWNVGAPLPHVFSSGSRTLVVYNMREPDPAWDGSYATVVDPTSADLRLIAIVEFERCLAHKLGPPNDEVLHGHPLHGRGLVGYAAHVVERSRWIAELMKINSVHSQYNPEEWKQYRHYLLAFHDETFECIARSHSLKQTMSSFPEALDLCTKRILA